MSTLCLPHVHLRLGRIIELRSGTGDVWKNDDVSVAPNPHAFVEGVQKQLGAKLYRSTSPLHFKWTLYHYVIHHVMYLTMPHHLDDTWCSCHIFLHLCRSIRFYTFQSQNVSETDVSGALKATSVTSGQDTFLQSHSIGTREGAMQFSSSLLSFLLSSS